MDTSDPPVGPVRDDALAIARAWLDTADLEDLVRRRLAGLGPLGRCDVVAVGKAGSECARAARSVLGDVGRTIVITEPGGPALAPPAVTLFGEHPVPGPGSIAAGRALVEFLVSGGDADTTVLLVSGGASSLSALPMEPLEPSDLAEVWRASLAAGLDITELNTLRASGSALGGGALLRHVATPVTVSLVMVDNVVSGAPWVASGLTYDHDIGIDELSGLLARTGLAGTDLERRIVAAADRHAALVDRPVITECTNLVLAEPADMVRVAAAEARRRGYQVVDLGARIVAPVDGAARSLLEALDGPGPICALGAGEVAIAVAGPGRGGRCQELAARCVPGLAHRGGVVAALASDGRDHEPGVAGAIVDDTTSDRARAAGIDLAAALEAHDTHDVLDRLGALVAGGHTGWNLCDLYVACRGDDHR